MTIFTKRNSRAAKVNSALVQEIRDKYSSGGYTQSSLSREYQISIGQIGRIVRGESWQGGLAAVHHSEAEHDEIKRRLLAVAREVELNGPDAPAIVPLPVNPDARKKANEWFDRAVNGDRKPPPSAFDDDYIPPEEPLEGGSGLERLKAETSKTGDAMLTELKGDKDGSE